MPRGQLPCAGQALRFCSAVLQSQCSTTSGHTSHLGWWHRPRRRQAAVCGGSRGRRGRRPAGSEREADGGDGAAVGCAADRADDHCRELRGVLASLPRNRMLITSSQDLAV